jgi:dTDP-glucose pyrophosphorylase
MIKIIIICLDETSDFQVLLDIISYLQRYNYMIYCLSKKCQFKDNFKELFNKVIFYENNEDHEDHENNKQNNIKKIFYDISEYKLGEILVISSYYDILKSCKYLYINSYYSNINELSGYNIMETIKYYEYPNTGILKKTALKKNINIVIPMAGEGRRFLTNPRDTTPKLLRDICNTPIISWTLNNIRIDANYIFILRETPYTIRLKDILRSMIPDCHIIITKTSTQGSACSILLAENLINKSIPLLVANDNQWLDWDPEEFVLDFLVKREEECAKVKLATFISNGSHRFKYVQLDDHENIVYVRHDKPISQFAITGISIWRNGEDFVRCAHKMISSNKRINGEFCLDLITNEMLDEIKREKEEISDKEQLDKEIQKTNFVIKREYEFFTSLQDHDDVYNFTHYWKHRNSF